MARSFKKHPFIKDPHAKEKRLASRRFRRIIRQRVKPWKDRYYYQQRILCGFCECDEIGLCPWVYIGDEPILPHPFEITNPYDVCDWKSNPYKPRYRRMGVDPRDRRK